MELEKNASLCLLLFVRPIYRRERCGRLHARLQPNSASPAAAAALSPLGSPWKIIQFNGTRGLKEKKNNKHWLGSHIAPRRAHNQSAAISRSPRLCERGQANKAFQLPNNRSQPTIQEDGPTIQTWNTLLLPLRLDVVEKKNEKTKRNVGLVARSTRGSIY